MFGDLQFQNPAASGLAKLLPVEIQGWTAVDPDKIFDAETIFDTIDGAGEVYRAYNMKVLLSRTYRKSDRPDIIADLFDMGSAADAFGVFTHDLDGEDWKIGQGCVYKGGLLSFWKDRYFVSLYAEGETEETKAALRALGRGVESAIPREGEKPALLGILPSTYADPKRVHYLHSPVILNYHFFVGSDNILGLDATTEAVLVKAADKSALVVVRYIDEGKAAAALKNLRQTAPLEARERGIFRTPEGVWNGSTSAGRTLAAVFRVSSADMAENILKQVLDKAALVGR